MIAQADKKIILGGRIKASFYIARLTGHGQFDTAFGTRSGATYVTFSRGGGVSALALQADGKILAAGHALGTAVARLTSKGLLDKTFGSGGKCESLYASKSEFPRTIAVQADGRVVISGIRAVGATDHCQTITASQAFVQRLSKTGRADASMGVEGYRNLSMGPYSDLYDNVIGQAIIGKTGIEVFGTYRNDFAVAKLFQA